MTRHALHGRRLTDIKERLWTAMSFSRGRSRSGLPHPFQLYSAGQIESIPYRVLQVDGEIYAASFDYGSWLKSPVLTMTGHVHHHIDRMKLSMP
jgi:hypothetical protein